MNEGVTRQRERHTLLVNGQQPAVGMALLKVMVSSNFTDMKPERAAVRDAILRAGMHPLMMETYSAAVAERGIVTNSWQMVDEADIYIVLLSNYRYGQIVTEIAHKPNRLSVTELEFDRAEGRGLKPCVFVQQDPYDYTKGSEPSHADVQREAKDKRKLAAFRAKAQNHERIVAPFGSVEQLEKLVLQTLTDRRKTTEPSLSLQPHLSAKKTDPTFLSHQFEVPSQMNYTADAFGLLVRGWLGPVRVFDQDGVAYNIGLRRFWLDLATDGCQTEGKRHDDPANKHMAIKSTQNGWVVESPDGRIFDESFELILAQMKRATPDAEPSVVLKASALEGDFTGRPAETPADDEAKAAGVIGLFLGKHPGRRIADGGTSILLCTSVLGWKPVS